MHLLEIILIIVFIPGILFILNSFKKRQLKKLSSIYEEYVNDASSLTFKEKKYEVIKLFQSAGLRDPQIPLVQPVGSRHEVKGHYSVFDNLTKASPEFINRVRDLFCEAIGVYKKRANNSINPIYWLEVILFLPERIINYLGLNNGSSSVTIISKTLNIVYWITTMIVTILRIKLIYFPL